MRADRAEAERRAEVRRGARGWRRAGAIDEATLAAVAAAYPDDRVRMGPVFRTLLFLFAFLAVNAAFGFVCLIFDLDPDDDVFPVLTFAWAAALAALTELLTGRFRRAQWGVEAAASLAALGCLAVGTLWVFLQGPGRLEELAIPGLLAVMAAATAAAAWRWGFPAYGASAAVLGFLLLARAPFGRFLWVVAALVLCPLFLRLAEAARLAPSHRDSFFCVAVVGLAALYFAVNLGSLDGRLVETMGGQRWTAAPVPEELRWLSIAGTAALPAVLLVWGFRSRRRTLLLSGTVATVLSLVTWRAYEDFAPVWLCLMLLGAVAVAAALAVRKLLDTGPSRERGGFTAEPLFADLEEQRALEAGAAVLTSTPEATAAQQERFTGGGGDFGGGGSSTDF